MSCDPHFGAGRGPIGRALLPIAVRRGRMAAPMAVSTASASSSVSLSSLLLLCSALLAAVLVLGGRGHQSRGRSQSRSRLLIRLLRHGEEVPTPPLPPGTTRVLCCSPCSCRCSCRCSRLASRPDDRACPWLMSPAAAAPLPVLVSACCACPLAHSVTWQHHTTSARMPPATACATTSTRPHAPTVRTPPATCMQELPRNANNEATILAAWWCLIAVASLSRLLFRTDDACRSLD